MQQELYLRNHRMSSLERKEVNQKWRVWSNLHRILLRLQIDLRSRIDWAIGVEEVGNKATEGGAAQNEGAEYISFIY